MLTLNDSSYFPVKYRFDELSVSIAHTLNRALSPKLLDINLLPSGSYLCRYCLLTPTTRYELTHILSDWSIATEHVQVPGFCVTHFIVPFESIFAK